MSLWRVEYPFKSEVKDDFRFCCILQVFNMLNISCNVKKKQPTLFNVNYINSV